MVDVVLLLATILALMGAAAGIAIGFPLALEVVSTHAHATMVASADTGADRRAEEGQPAPLIDARYRPEPEEELEDYDDPLIVDDVRSAARMYAAAGFPGSGDRSAPAASGNGVPGRLSQ
jgi:hypothetical protein